MTNTTKGRKPKIEIKVGQVWEPKRGTLWARVLGLKNGKLTGSRVKLEKYDPKGNYKPYKIDIAERSFRGDYKLVEEAELAKVREALTAANIRAEVDMVAGVKVLAAARDQLAEDMRAMLDEHSSIRDDLRQAGIPDHVTMPEGVKRLRLRLREGAFEDMREEVLKLRSDIAHIVSAFHDCGGVGNPATASAVATFIRAAHSREVALLAENRALKEAHGRNLAQWQKDELEAVQSAMPTGFSLVCHPQTPGDSRAWFCWSTEQTKPAVAVGSPFGALKLAWGEYCRVLGSELDKAKALAERIVALVNKPEAPPVAG